jgi:cyclic pyranopterin phosphate synthase
MSNDALSGLTHIDGKGRAVMVDVTGKAITERRAITSGLVVGLTDAPGFLDDHLDLLTEARMAGLRAAKATSELIPLCHPVPLEAIAIDFRIHPHAIEVAATTATVAQTGVEMEALCACAVAALSVLGRVRETHPYASIEQLGLLEKRGGRSGLWQRTPNPRHDENETTDSFVSDDGGSSVSGDQA